MKKPGPGRRVGERHPFAKLSDYEVGLVGGVNLCGPFAL